MKKKKILLKFLVMLVMLFSLVLPVMAEDDPPILLGTYPSGQKTAWTIPEETDYIEYSITTKRGNTGYACECWNQGSGETASPSGTIYIKNSNEDVVDTIPIPTAPSGKYGKSSGTLYTAQLGEIATMSATYSLPSQAIYCSNCGKSQGTAKSSLSWTIEAYKYPKPKTPVFSGNLTTSLPKSVIDSEGQNLTSVRKKRLRFPEVF